ncbi:MAG: hypothetical protein WCJ51_01390 [Candidatus Moraniibacteriota bacterium]
MQTEKFRKKEYGIGFVLLTIVGLFFGQLKKDNILVAGDNFSLGLVALAEDDEDEDEKDEEDGEDDDDEKSSTQISSPASQSTTTVKKVIKLPDQIVTKTVLEDVVLPDGDNDGIPDESDPHPTVPEYLIVSDANGNGIDDRYDFSL